MGACPAECHHDFFPVNINQFDITAVPLKDRPYNVSDCFIDKMHPLDVRKGVFLCRLRRAYRGRRLLYLFCEDVFDFMET